jgi:hypothetical protein
MPIGSTSFRRLAHVLKRGISRAEKSSPAESNMSQSAAEIELERIKAIVAPFREIFNITLQEQYMERIIRIVYSKPAADSMYPGSPIYTLHDGSIGQPPDLQKGAAAFPPKSSARLRTAITKLNTCDLAVNSFLSRLADCLRPLDATVQWLTVRASPRFILRYVSSDSKQPIHSVTCITTKSGAQFVADFTIEQFGYDEDYWFTELPDYLALCTIDGKYRVTTDVEIAENAADIATCNYEGAMTTLFRRACDAIDWPVVHALSPDERMELVRARTIETLHEKPNTSQDPNPEGGAARSL